MDGYFLRICQHTKCSNFVECVQSRVPQFSEMLCVSFRSYYNFDTVVGIYKDLCLNQFLEQVFNWEKCLQNVSPCGYVWLLCPLVLLSLESIGACKNCWTLVMVLWVLKSVVVRNVGLVGACTMEIEVLAVGWIWQEGNHAVWDTDLTPHPRVQCTRL